MKEVAEGDKGSGAEEEKHEKYVAQYTDEYFLKRCTAEKPRFSRRSWRSQSIRCEVSTGAISYWWQMGGWVLVTKLWCGRRECGTTPPRPHSISCIVNFTHSPSGGKARLNLALSGPNWRVNSFPLLLLHGKQQWSGIPRVRYSSRAYETNLRVTIKSIKTLERVMHAGALHWWNGSGNNLV